MSQPQMKHGPRVTLILATTLVVAGCNSRALPSPTPGIATSVPADSTPSLPSVVSIEDTPSGPASPGCIDITIQSSSAPPSVERTLAFASAIIDGVFRRYAASRWNTPSGLRPEPDQERNGSPVILRPLVIDPARVLRGDPTVRTRSARAGGELGCDRVTFDTSIQLASGSRYVLFFFDAIDSEGHTSGDAILFDAWPVDARDKVQSRGQGPMTLDELATRIAAAPRASD
jgi:hypothetical protein